MTSKEENKPALIHFDSKGEAIYYERFVLPLLESGDIVSCDVHHTFEIIPKVEFQGSIFAARRFKPDFVLTYKDGHVKVVEVKARYVRQAQRDYPLRRQLFLINYCIPNGWEFEEVCSNDLMKKYKRPTRQDTLLPQQ